MFWHFACAVSIDFAIGSSYGELLHLRLAIPQPIKCDCLFFHHTTYSLVIVCTRNEFNEIFHDLAAQNNSP